MSNGWKMNPIDWINFFYLLVPLIDALVSIAEKLFRKPSQGVKKTEFVVNTVSNILPIPKEIIAVNLPPVIDSIVKENNDSGIFNHIVLDPIPDEIEEEWGY